MKTLKSCGFTLVPPVWSYPEDSAWVISNRSFPFAGEETLASERERLCPLRTREDFQSLKRL